MKEGGYNWLIETGLIHLMMKEVNHSSIMHSSCQRKQHQLNMRHRKYLQQDNMFKEMYRTRWCRMFIHHI